MIASIVAIIGLVALIAGILLAVGGPSPKRQGRDRRRQFRPDAVRANKVLHANGTQANWFRGKGLQAFPRNPAASSGRVSPFRHHSGIPPSNGPKRGPDDIARVACGLGCMTLGAALLFVALLAGLWALIQWGIA